MEKNVRVSVGSLPSIPMDGVYEIRGEENLLMFWGIVNDDENYMVRIVRNKDIEIYIDE
jgi:hypothetical protein